MQCSGRDLNPSRESSPETLSLEKKASAEKSALRVSHDWPVYTTGAQKIIVRLIYKFLLVRFYRAFNLIKNIAGEKMKRVYFITTNETKFQVAKKVLKKYSIDVVRKNWKYKEIQADKLEDVVRAALERIEISPAIIEDSGLFISALRGFPGVYSSYAQRTIGAEGMLKLMRSKKNRSARFESVVGFKSGNRIKLFRGRVEGRILKEKRGERGYGFDMIFCPIGSGKSFAEMSFAEMLQCSDWKKSFESFARWFAKSFG